MRRQKSSLRGEQWRTAGDVKIFQDDVFSRAPLKSRYPLIREKRAGFHYLHPQNFTSRSCLHGARRRPPFKLSPRPTRWLTERVIVINGPAQRLRNLRTVTVQSSRITKRTASRASPSVARAYFEILVKAYLRSTIPRTFVRSIDPLFFRRFFSFLFLSFPSWTREYFTCGIVYVSYGPSNLVGLIDFYARKTKDV